MIISTTASTSSHYEELRGTKQSNPSERVGDRIKIAFLTPEYPHPKTGNSGGIGTSIKNLTVLWCSDKTALTVLIKNILENKISNVTEAKKWFEIVVGNQPTKASENIWTEIDSCIK